MRKERVKIGFERPNPLHMRWLICALVDSCTADEQKLLRSTCLCPICDRSIPPGPELNSCLVQGGSEDKTEHETLADRHPCLLPKPQNNNEHKKLVFSYTILQHFCHQIFQICVQQTKGGRSGILAPPLARSLQNFNCGEDEMEKEREQHTWQPLTSCHCCQELHRRRRVRELQYPQALPTLSPLLSPVVPAILCIRRWRRIFLPETFKRRGPWEDNWHIEDAKLRFPLQIT